MNEEVVNESRKCLNCKNAKCQMACPLNNDIPLMISLIKDGKYEEAFLVNQKTNPLGAICGIVCPREKLCEGACIQGLKNESIKIGKIENELGQYAITNSKLKNDEKITKSNVAIIGGGVAGISCAYFLAKNNISSTIFEKEDYLGGILIYGIPNFRLDKKLVEDAINCAIDSKYINVKKGYKLVSDEKAVDSDKYITIRSLKEQGYEHIILAFGNETSTSLNIENINSKYVILANSFLKMGEEKLKELISGKKVAVVGGGNVAIDCSRLSNRLGAETTIVYRRLRENMPANVSEIEEAYNENVAFLFKKNVVAIKELENEKTNVRVALDTGERLDIDYLVLAIGSKINRDYVDNDLKLDEENKYLLLDDNYETTVSNVYAIGDLANSKGLVVNAIKNGRDVAKEIYNKIKT